MKRNILSLCAAVLAISFIAFSAFKKSEFKLNKKDAPSKYVTYDGTGAQNDVSNYNLSTAPTTAPDPCDLAAQLCWFRVDDLDHDNDIDAADFAASFEIRDVINDDNNTLNDDSEDGETIEKKQ